jgi:aryl-alcohol dehydrogenase-like predicted oxidoreductase
MSENAIPTKPFGRTGHESTRTIFGAAAFSQVTQYEADATLAVLQTYGVNHIDTARSYGDAELRVGPWMRKERKNFFLASKTGMRTKQKALEELKQSLDRLQTDYIDLWQFHFLVDENEWKTAMSENGVLEAAIEAKKQGLIRYIGVTGHELAAPTMHLKSLEKYPFDSVLFPYNYILMKNDSYAVSVRKLMLICAERGIAVQTIKSIARGPVETETKKYAPWYDPLDSESAIKTAVHWVLKNDQVFLNTVSDISLLPFVLKAASEYQIGPEDSEMEVLLDSEKIKPLFL